ncbi:MAG: hypothetical protein NTX01_03910 [Candidatus Omnitrophica bacterium]|nr:hypothetical protein [Candidatus Omnitrophota bacterium]
MKINAKIRVYTILKWTLYVLSLAPAIEYTLTSKGSFNILLALGEVTINPVLWIALILRWRILVNKNLFCKEGHKETTL